MRFTTDAELADTLKMTVDQVRFKCRNDWPCFRPHRSVWLFTEAMVEEIVEKETVKPAPRVPTSARSRRARRSA